MNWFNAPISISRSPEYIGSDPVQRATWFSLIMYCVGQENAGVIRDSKQWKDRRWQQTAGVTSEEVTMECDLFWWDGEDLHVAFYPIDSEGEVNRKRETARVNGKLGGRPRGKPTGNNQETNVGYLVSETQEPTTKTSVTGLSEPNNQKDKIREDKERQYPLPPRGFESVGREISETPKNPDATAHGDVSGLEAIKARINSLKPEWGKPSRWNSAEEHQLFGGSAAQFEEMTEDDWTLIRRYLNTRMPEGAAFWQPRNRQKFVETFSAVFADAQRWEGKKRPQEARKPPPTVPFQPMDRAELSDFFKRPEPTPKRETT